MEDLRPKVLDFVRRNGPVLPVQISKVIGGNIILAGAVMSELVHNKKLLISHAKVGGSPVYYLSGQEYKLSILYKHLKEKERKIYDLLREKRVLKDIELEPWQRVALRDLKDFAVMLKVSNKDVEEIFWKWYLLDDKSTEDLIREKIEGKLEVEEKKGEIEGAKEVKEKEIIKETKEKVIKEKIIKEKVKIEKPILNVFDYFKKKNIEVLEESIIRKNKEMDYTIKVDSEVGKIKFFVKVMNKAKINNKDLILALSQAQLKRLPLLFLSNRELTKKGKEYLEKNHLLFEKI